MANFYTILTTILPAESSASSAHLLMISCDGDLDHERPDQSVVEVLEGHDHPAGGLGQLDDLDLLEVVEVGPATHRDLGRGVRLVQTEVGVHRDSCWHQACFCCRFDTGCPGVTTTTTTTTIPTTSLGPGPPPKQVSPEY